jgi:hypothetical protein
MGSVSKSLVLVILLLTTVSCAARKPDAPEREAPKTTVEVQNQAWLDMKVYVLSGSRRVRLGTVPSASTRVFTIPPYLIFGLTSLRFLADPIGADAGPVSQEITVAPGDQVEMIIPNR